ncbi:endonuclease/exonuclease/phosphatase family protein [Chitinophaga ginsengisegetis]|uniref:endonuclease/exonuclease/phosphatase family protein n=1 Tax=Chitinophaga ginsengisegetis TaxID=393003 RepID=UPI000DB99614|nr:endonuclease/exonuclease/phosphatase family protein [Chitinophaga ginsengisegetis]MDR6569228.1 endonuclease/exonuclease/phosphatase family metal-dependent hydrolase [Chitinophaga ginsengisegetis]MDR6648742.1 endonuclease/exonuclease/phosphatase family metal-dependent hydrolase [Chitinophaga ginsengisegetis]MDR6655310.1 endonuclease/exonuclease/phosphatase family metal-dependent hydrolase [Chitinophaga ginsengisegetis]
MKIDLCFRYWKKVSLTGICIIAGVLVSRAQTGNQALLLDGNDNNPCIGMDIIRKQWTVEAWIKGNDNIWKAKEVIIGGGEYSEYPHVDNRPLMIQNGHLHSEKAHITATGILDSNWHHVAATCNGAETKLYLDGREVGRAKGAVDILPGAIGTNDMDSSTFGGCIDEVRIWTVALSPAAIRQWMYQSLSARHPDFKALKGYYTFDDMQDDVSLNLVGKGHQAYHMRNTRKNYKGKLPLATLVKNDNPLFKTPTGKQQLFNAVTIQSEWDADQGSINDQVLKLRIVANGSKDPLKLTALQLDLSRNTNLSDIAAVHVYYAGKSPRSATRKELSGSGKVPQQRMQLILPPADGYTLQDGVNYFLVTFDVKKEAVAGDTLYADVASFALNGVAYTPQAAHSNIVKTVVSSSATSPYTVKLLQWNIWHGGVHVGNNGPNRIKELLLRTNADIISMQEAYGTQQFLNDTLGFHLQTSAPGANLALFSRYPLEKHSSNDNFKSNTAVVQLPGNRKVLIGNWWLRYAYKHEYTDFYPIPGLNTNDWVKEDSELAVTDARKNLEQDIDPVVAADTSLPVILAGDFNSGSHLDWTERAAFLHYGYGPVLLPASGFMLERGYRDSYRELQPNEVTHQGGTFAAIYGHLQTSRIDFIYYKGPGIKAVSSKIIRTAPEIDDVWASDHAAVLTVFDIR